MPYADPEDKRANARKYRAAHREAMRAKGRAYYYANREQALIAARVYAAAHREEKAAYNTTYQAIRQDKLRTYQQAYRVANRAQRNAGSLSYYYANREYLRAYARAYRTANPGVHRAYRATHPEVFRAKDARRRALQLGLGAGATTEQIAARWEMWGDRCWMCGAPATCTDHVKPLSKGGSNLPANLRPACGPCNGHKHNQWPLPVAA